MKKLLLLCFITHSIALFSTDKLELIKSYVSFNSVLYLSFEVFSEDIIFIVDEVTNNYIVLRSRTDDSLLTIIPQSHNSFRGHEDVYWPILLKKIYPSQRYNIRVDLKSLDIDRFNSINLVITLSTFNIEGMRSDQIFLSGNDNFTTSSISSNIILLNKINGNWIVPKNEKR